MNESKAKPEDDVNMLDLDPLGPWPTVPGHWSAVKPSWPWAYDERCFWSQADEAMGIYENQHKVIQVFVMLESLYIKIQVLVMFES